MTDAQENNELILDYQSQVGNIKLVEKINLLISS
jgi:hypothetical protein